MSYNWQLAATPQGRERLKELIEDGHQIATRRTGEGRYKYIITHSELDPHSGDLVIDNDIYGDWEDAEESNAFDDLEFLDPEPPAPVVDENGLLPCAHCGGKAEIENNTYPRIPKYETIIRCSTGVWECAASQYGFSKESHEESFAICKPRWNRRANQGGTGK